jgi:hypothetical protein
MDQGQRIQERRGEGRAQTPPARLGPRADGRLVRASPRVSLVRGPVRGEKAERDVARSLIASVTLRWCSAQVPNLRRGRIFPRSGTKPESSFTSL